MTAYDPYRYLTSVQDILQEHLRDTFPQADYDVTFEYPELDEPAKPVIWFRLVKSVDGKSTQFMSDGSIRQGFVKTLEYEVIIVTVEATGGSRAAWDTASRFESEVVMSGRTALGAAGLKHADCTSFVLLPFPAPSKQWRMEAQLSFDVLVERR
jgi:hypothetical protein